VTATREDAYLQIGEVAERLGVTHRTLRFYEEKGLLKPPTRMDGGFRLYSEEDVRRVERIKQLQRLLGKLPPGGVLAVQIPDSGDEPAHVLTREVARQGPWAKQLSEKARVRDTLPTPGGYYDALSPLCTRLDIWHTIYNHVLDDAAAVVEWVKGTGLRPFLDMLETSERKEFLAEYTARVAATYLPQADGKVLFRFPRIFIVATK